MGKIIWLASYPKSGNTWTRTFINNLLLDPDEPVDINILSDLTPGDARKSWYEKAAGIPYHRLSMGQVVSLRPKVHQLIADLQDESVFVKTHSLYGQMHGVPLITMDCTAGAIYVIRNPLDVVVSVASHFGLAIDGAIQLMGDPNAFLDEAPTLGNIRQYFGSWSGHANSWTHFDREKMHVMRYEDMQDKPEETFTNMVKFLGMEFPEERIAKAIEFSSFDVARKQEDEKGFKEQSAKNDKFFRVGKAGQWKDILSDAQIDQIINTHQVTMKYFGYLPD